MILDSLLTKMVKQDMSSVFEAYYRARIPNADAIANMAHDNFTEMMSRTADSRFLLEKAIEIQLAQRFPLLYATRYSLITHSLVPYRLCFEIGLIQQKILTQLSEGVSRVEDVDFSLAALLVKEKLSPFLTLHSISSSDFNYSSKYYPQPKASM